MSTPQENRKIGLPPGVESGPLGGRLLAYVIDHALPAVLVGIATGVALGTQLNGRGRTVLLIVTIVVSLLWGLIVWRMYALRAAGPGMRVAKLQLVGYRDGRPLGWGRFLLRWLVLSLLTATVVGLVVMLVLMVRQVRRQGWHDLAADSVVIRQRSLAPPRASARSADTPSSAPSAAAPSAVGPAATAEDESPASASTSPATPAPTVPAAEPVPTGSGAGWVITFDDGWDLLVDGPVLLGRNPQPQPGEEQARAVKIADTTRTVSKTHLAVGVDSNGLYVMDRGSTNGSTVTTADGFSMRCAEGDVIAVEDGSIVSFGDHWFRVGRG